MKSKSKTGGSKLKVGFLMDPIEKINLTTDTTFLLMLEAQRRGHQIFYLRPGDLRVENGAPASRIFPAAVKNPTRPDEPHFKLEPPLDRPLSDLDLIFNRVDPPYDLAYVTMTQLLALVPPTTVIANRPSGVLIANEKILALRFPALMPETIVTPELDRLEAFLKKVGGKMVVKPLELYGGVGVFVVARADTNRRVILETMTDFGRRPIIAQRFLPVSQKGDKRIILLDGQPIGAMLRFPPKHDHRANLHSGGAARPANLSPADLELCRAVGPFLHAHGLYLAGLDLIAGKLTEINVTSPTLVKQINQFSGLKLEERILDFHEYLARMKRPEA